MYVVDVHLWFVKPGLVGLEKPTACCGHRLGWGDESIMTEAVSLFIQVSQNKHGN